MDYHGTTRNYVCWDGALALKAATKGLEGAQAPRYFAEVRMTSATKGGNGIMAATTDVNAEWSPEARFRVTEGVIGEVLDAETVLLDLERGLYFRLNRTGTELWRSLEADGRLGVAEKALLAQFDVEPAELRRDIISLATELQANGLIAPAKS